MHFLIQHTKITTCNLQNVPHIVYNNIIQLNVVHMCSLNIAAFTDCDFDEIYCQSESEIQILSILGQNRELHQLNRTYVESRLTDIMEHNKFTSIGAKLLEFYKGLHDKWQQLDGELLYKGR